jgi:3'-phosphoadenosine 5'-phosphosulfate sulfotransferase (PAPS reductase)/FAD synthetase
VSLKSVLESLSYQVAFCAEVISAATSKSLRARRRLIISFSGGETSAYMSWLLLTTYRDRWDDIIIVFANTGQENEETLVFVDMCDRLLFAPLGFRVIWIEAVQQHGARKGALGKVVTFETATRDGSLFEDMIRKYGIPNRKYPHCNRELKLNPIINYARSIGWETKSYETAIGIRADEIDRMSSKAEANRLIYPLIQLQPTTKPQINSWFKARPFRLQLKGYQGNCRWCWKKTFRKHFTIISENPDFYEFPRQMEQRYGKANHESRLDPSDQHTPLADDYRRTFFRENKSADDLFAEYEKIKDTFVPAEDDAVVYDPSLDTGGGCEESCEVFADEDMIASEEEEA